jgi:hypothetical protein
LGILKRGLYLVYDKTACASTIGTQQEETQMQQFGHILFALGLIFAFAAGLGIQHPGLPIGLAFFGIFVGLFNVASTDTTKFMLTGIALEVSASAFKQFTFVGAAMTDVMIFVGGALLVVALRVMLGTAFTGLWKTRE